MAQKEDAVSLKLVREHGGLSAEKPNDFGGNALYVLYTQSFRNIIKDSRLMLKSRSTILNYRDSISLEENMREAEFKEKKSELERALQERDELNGRISQAEIDLKEMLLLMEQFKSEGQRAEFEEINDAYQQSYPDYSDMLRELTGQEQKIQAMQTELNRTEEYFRDTGFFPGR